MNETGRIIGAMFIGAIVGAALGVLFAPEKGSTTRSNIADGAKDLADGAMDLASELKQKMKEEATILRKKAEKLEDLAEDKVEDVIDDIKKEAKKATKSTKTK